MHPIAILRAMRPHQWVKNLFVLAALLFSRTGQSDFGLLWAEAAPVLMAALAFCLGASAIYLINDVLDIESDRQHPTKCKRPIPAGEVRIPVALLVSLACVLSAVVLGVLSQDGEYQVAGVVSAYMAMNLAYSLRLKHIVIVDAFTIAAGFLLRLQAGALAADVRLSPWILLCTFFLALFLAFCKRRAETSLLGADRGEHRKILTEYTPEFLEQITVALAACTILTYSMYTVDVGTTARFGKHMVYTVPFVVFGLFRYLLLVQTQKGGGSPTRVLLGGDPVFVFNCLAYAVAVVGLMRLA